MAWLPPETACAFRVTAVCRDSCRPSLSSRSFPRMKQVLGHQHCRPFISVSRHSIAACWRCTNVGYHSLYLARRCRRDRRKVGPVSAPSRVAGDGRGVRAGRRLRRLPTAGRRDGPTRRSPAAEYTRIVYRPRPSVIDWARLDSAQPGSTLHRASLETVPCHQTTTPDT